MRKVFLVLLIAVLLVPAISLAWDRGHGGHRGNYYGNHDRGGYNHGGYHRGYNGGDFWLRVGTAIIGGAVIGAFTSPYYYEPHYTAPCTRELRYGHWERDFYGREYWVTTRVEYEPCRRW